MLHSTANRPLTSHAIEAETLAELIANDERY